MIEEQQALVDFKTVMTAVNIDEVLEHYGLHSIDWSKRAGHERWGKCPLPNSGCKDARCFHVNLKTNAFHCFSCMACGNVFDFVAAMETCSVRDAALKLADWFKVGEVSNLRQESQKES